MTPTAERINEATHNPRMPIGLGAAHPYIDAKLAFVAGRITRMQAAAMIASDRQWIAECELRGRDKLEAARVVVDTQWAAELVAARQKEKRGVASGLFATSGHAYCGPVALAAITGASIEAVHAAVLEHRRTCPAPARHRLRGAVVRTMWSNEIAPVAALLGFKAELLLCHPRPTFRQWQALRRRDGTQARNEALIVLVTGHFVAVRGELMVDTQHRQPVRMRDTKRCARSRVVCAWRLTKAEG